MKKAALLPQTLAETLTSARYTTSRIRRIALQNLLQIEEKLVKESLQAPLYLRILAIRKERSDLLSALSSSSLPILIRANDKDSLTGVAKKVYERDAFAEKVYDLLYPESCDKNVFL